MAAHHPKRRRDQTIEYKGDLLIVDVWQMPWSTLDHHDPVGVAELGPSLSVLVRQTRAGGRWKTLKEITLGGPPEELARQRSAALDPLPGDRIEYYGEDGCTVLDIVEVTLDSTVVLERMLGDAPERRTIPRSELRDHFLLADIFMGSPDPRRRVECALCGHVRWFMSDDTVGVLCTACAEPLTA